MEYVGIGEGNEKGSQNLKGGVTASSLSFSVKDKAPIDPTTRELPPPVRSLV